MIKKKRNRKSKYPIHVNVRISSQTDKGIKEKSKRDGKRYTDVIRESLNEIT